VSLVLPSSQLPQHTTVVCCRGDRKKVSSHDATRLDGDEISRLDFDQRLETLTEVAPVHGLVRRGDVIVADGAALQCCLCVGQRCSAEIAQDRGTGDGPLDETATRWVFWQRWTLPLQRIAVGEGVAVVSHAFGTCQRLHTALLWRLESPPLHTAGKIDAIASMAGWHLL
jgi:hypothetical protein